jgi:hypothetical protein
MLLILMQSIKTKYVPLHCLLSKLRFCNLGTQIIFLYTLSSFMFNHLFSKKKKHPMSLCSLIFQEYVCIFASHVHTSIFLECLSNPQAYCPSFLIYISTEGINVYPDPLIISQFEITEFFFSFPL